MRDRSREAGRACDALLQGVRKKRDVGARLARDLRDIARKTRSHMRAWVVRALRPAQARRAWSAAAGSSGSRRRRARARRARPITPVIRWRGGMGLEK